MPFNLVNLERASFRGVEFLVDSQSIISGRKTIVYEFPNKQFRSTEDQGLLQRTFNVIGFVRDDNFRVNRQNLIDALKQEKTGKLFLPLDGEINVATDPFTLEDNFNDEAGLSRFSMVFFETDDPTFPTQADNNLSFLNQLSRDTLELAEQASAAAFVITDGFIDILTDAQDTLANFSRAFDAITRPFDAAIGALAEFSLALQNFEQNLFNFLGQPGATAAAIDELLITFSLLSDNALLRFQSSESLFGFKTDYESIPPTTFSRIEIRNNRQTIQSQIAYEVLSLAYNDAALIDFRTQEEGREIQEDLEAQYVFVRDNNNFDSTVLDILKDLRVQFNRNIETRIGLAARIIEIETAETTLTELVYRYYGNLDNTFIINSLNNFPNPSRISGTIRILSNG